MNLRSATIRLAHDRPDLRPHLLPILRLAIEFPTQDALDAYLKDHPNADKAKHTVKKTDGEGGEGDENEVPEWGSLESKIKGKLKSFLKTIPGVAKEMSTAISKAPAKVQQFVVDPEVRKEAMTSMADKVKKSPKKVLEAVWEGAKKEVKEIKHAGKALAKALKKPPEEWDDEDRKAVYAAAVYASGAVIAAAGGGPLAAAGVLGKAFTLHVGFKALSHSIDRGFTHFEAAETGAHGMEHTYHMFQSFIHGAEAVGHHLASDRRAKEGEDNDEAFQQALMGQLTAAITEVLEKGLTDEEMEAVLKGDEPDISELGQPKARKGKKDEGKSKGKEAALRAQVIRLAHDHPELRGQLLPLVR